MANSVETVIVGGGQAGLSLSYYLTQAKRDHIVLDRAAQAADSWRNHKWDSFTLVTPNWAIQLPGAEYDASDPDGFMPRDEVVRYFENYIHRFNLPIQFNMTVKEVEPTDDGYLVMTDDKTVDCKNLVVATSLFQHPKIPAFSREVPSEIMQLHTSQYRNPSALPAGAVLVVGSGQSGCQIAEELYRSGRKVYLCVGSAGRGPRQYRGKDIFYWLREIHFFDRTVDKLPSPRAKFAGNPHVSGTNGGHTINLHRFARDGVLLLGHIQDIQDNKVILAPDLKENLAKVDKFEADLIQAIDKHITDNRLDYPVQELPQLTDGYETEEIRELDLQERGITTIIWAFGYGFDFNWVKLPVFDDDGYPIQRRGVSQYKGLYFLGLHWLHTLKSGLLMGISEDAAHIAAQIAAG